jgi:Protein of unknown function (DUF3987)
VTDWIETYVAETEKVPSPEIYRLWSAITAISGALERKVYTTGSAGPIYPNLTTLLVGPPGSGKTNAISPIRKMWSHIHDLHIAPDNVTKAALIDSLSRSVRTVINGAASAYVFSAMAVPCSEFGVFFTHHDLEFLSVLNHIYDCPDTYREERRSSGVVEINKPYLTILAGTQPDFLQSFLPDEAWGMGFTSRLILIYAPANPSQTDLFSGVTIQSNGLTSRLSEIFAYKGEIRWSKEAIDELNAWNRAGCPPTPQHSRLLHYNSRRGLHTLKLAMISSASKSGNLIVTVDDVERAKDWLLAAEVHMPDVFRAMGAKSDGQVIDDLHYFMWRQYSALAIGSRKPIPQGDIYRYLKDRVTSERIPRIIEAAERMGVIRKSQYPDEWIPEPIGAKVII